MDRIALLSPIQELVDQLDPPQLTDERKEIMDVLVRYIQGRINNGKIAHLNFICTHNSRRSQFSQVWAQVLADYFGVKARCYSGGVEVTAFNERAVASLVRTGFQITSAGDNNPVYEITYAENWPAINAYSKLFDDPANPQHEFAAVMTCSHADENCPFIPGASERISMHFEDPKIYDGTDLEKLKYDERSRQIAAELFYVMRFAKNKLDH